LNTQADQSKTAAHLNPFQAKESAISVLENDITQAGQAVFLHFGKANQPQSAQVKLYKSIESSSQAIGKFGSF
jgi:hypothetical protein